MKKIKKWFSVVGVFFGGILTKLFSMTNVMAVSTFYGVVEPTKPTDDEKIWKFVKPLIIPAILLVGLVTYLVKSKSSKKKKTLVTIGVIAITAILYLVINKLVY